MNLSKEAKNKLLGAKIVKITDCLIIFDNTVSIVLTEEEVKCLNNSYYKE